MIKDQQLADMTISLGSIDPCFSCTDRLETIDLQSGATKVWSPGGTGEAGARSEGLSHEHCLLTILGRAGQRGAGAAAGAVLRGRAAQGHRAHPVPPGPAAAGSPTSTCSSCWARKTSNRARSPVMQRFAAYLSLATVLTVACLVPMGFAAPLNGAGDAILLIYLLTLSRHLHAAGRPGGRLHLLAARHQPRDDDHDRARTAVRRGHRRRRGAHRIVPARHGPERLGLCRRRLPVVGPGHARR